MNERSPVPSWLWLLIVLSLVVFIGFQFLDKDMLKLRTPGETKNQQARVEQKVIVLKPGRNITLEINDKEWSPWIDATYSGMHYYAHAENGLIFKFRNGKIKKVTPDKIENFGNGSHLFMFRLKSVSESDRAVIETSMESIVEKHIN